MGSHSEEPVTAPPTRRSLREAQRRSESGSTPATGTRPDPDSPAAHHVPSWAHHGPAAPRPSTPVTEALARSAPPQQARSAWSAGPQTRAASPTPSLPGRAGSPHAVADSRSPRRSPRLPAPPHRSRRRRPVQRHPLRPRPRQSAGSRRRSAPRARRCRCPTLPARIESPLAPAPRPVAAPTVPTSVRAAAPTTAASGSDPRLRPAPRPEPRRARTVLPASSRTCPSSRSRRTARSRAAPASPPAPPRGSACSASWRASRSSSR